jgi:hypothetical protein
VLYIETDSGRLRALQLADGQPLGGADIGSGANHFPAPAGSGELVVAPAGRSIVVFTGA